MEECLRQSPWLALQTFLDMLDEIGVFKRKLTSIRNMVKVFVLTV
jgi:hypothetical protein